MYTDSLGNRYERLPSRPPIHKAKPTTETSLRRSGRRKGSNPKTNKHAIYRARIGLPRGPGVPGTKSGKDAVH